MIYGVYTMVILIAVLLWKKSKNSTEYVMSNEWVSKKRNETNIPRY